MGRYEISSRSPTSSISIFSSRKINSPRSLAERSSTAPPRATKSPPTFALSSKGSPMLKIHKYRFEIISAGSLVVQMPHRAEILSCQLQDNHFTIWASFDVVVESTRELRRFVIIPTGTPFEGESWKFLTTIQDQHKRVWHVFEISTQV